MKKQMMIIAVILMFLGCQQNEEHGALKLNIQNALSVEDSFTVIATDYEEVFAEKTFHLTSNSNSVEYFDPGSGEGSFVIKYKNQNDTIGYFTNGFTTDEYAILIGDSGLSVSKP